MNFPEKRNNYEKKSRRCSLSVVYVTRCATTWHAWRGGALRNGITPTACVGATDWPPHVSRRILLMLSPFSVDNGEKKYLSETQMQLSDNSLDGCGGSEGARSIFLLFICSNTVAAFLYFLLPGKTFWRPIIRLQQMDVACIKLCVMKEMKWETQGE